MQRPHADTMLLRLFVCVLCCFVFFFSVRTPSALAQMGKPATVSPRQVSEASGAKRTVTIDFNDVDIGVLIKFISELTGKNFIVDNNVRGKVTIISPGKISVDEAYKVFESVLEVNGFAAVPAGEVIKIVPAAEARSKDIETNVTPAALPRAQGQEDRLVTQLIPLTYADASQVKTLLTPLVSRNSVILAYTETNTLIVTDVSSNIKRLLHIIKAIDVPGIGRQVTVVPLKYADAATMVKTLQSVFRASTSNVRGVSQKALQFVADDRTNSIIFLASENDAVRIKKLIALLDQNTPSGKGDIHVYRLENAVAEDVASVLQNLPKSQTGTTKSKNSAFVSNNISITADKATNSLIIMADSEDYDVLKGIIKKLDIPRSMVYIESLIMEVNVDKTFELGVNWSDLNNTTIGGDSGVVGGGFSNSGGFDPSTLAASSGLSLGVVTGSISLTTSSGTVTLPNLGAVINALESNQDVHILSTPRLLTTDNEEATIVVGKNVPYQTQTATSTSNNTYNSFEYKDVGLTLKITPHISKDRMVRLKISQVLTTLTGASTNITTTPTTLKRSVDTTVIVKDRSMLVIGGLIDDNITNTITTVPLLGHIPLFGRLFRYNSKVDTKTNLYIFITPRVINNPAEAGQLLSDTKAKMTPSETGLVKMYGPVESATDKAGAAESGGQGQ